MRNIAKTDEGTVAWVKPTNKYDKSAVLKVKILRVWEDADSLEFRYGNWSGCIADKDGFSLTTYRHPASEWQIAETISRYNQPLSFWRELKISLIRGIHLLMERMEFNFKN